MLLLAFLLVGAGTASAQKVTAVEDIEDGGHYYIGCTVSGTDYYLYVNPSVSAKGEKKESTEDATEFIFNKGENGWVIEIASSGKYITLPSSKDNAKVNVQDEAAEWEATNESDLIQLKINGFLLQGNNSSSLNFGSYASGQKNVWLLPVGTNIVETVKTPTFTPAAGEVEAGTQVTIKCETEGATIYYTTDGTEPSTESAEGTTVTVSEAVTIKAIAVKDGMNNSAVATATYTIKVAVVPVEGDFVLYTGTITPGDYIICYEGKAMKAGIASNRFKYEEVVPDNNTITNPGEDIVWTLAASDEYYTLYNASIGQYAASTGTKNQGALLEDGTDDKALWTVTVTDENTYEFVNKHNAEANVNANLRNNTTYGFACYSTTTGGALSLYKKSDGTHRLPTIPCRY